MHSYFNSYTLVTPNTGFSIILLYFFTFGRLKSWLDLGIITIALYVLSIIVGRAVSMVGVSLSGSVDINPLQGSFLSFFSFSRSAAI